jgi:hypothetical protein
MARRSGVCGQAVTNCSIFDLLGARKRSGVGPARFAPSLARLERSIPVRQVVEESAVAVIEIQRTSFHEWVDRGA